MFGMLDQGLPLLLRDIAPYTARAEVLSTRFLLLYLALLNQSLSAEARKHEVVSENASSLIQYLNTGRRWHFEQSH